MEKTNKKIIAVALVLSLITALMVYIYITGNKTGAAPEPEYATVYVAAATIPARSLIAKADVAEVKIAKELLNPRALSDINNIVGKRAVESILEGEQFFAERLADESNMPLSYSIPEGMKAVSINVSEQINVANLPRPGDFVDVVASFEKEEEKTEQTTTYHPRITLVLLQNVQVLALGQDIALSEEKLKEAPATTTLAIRKEDVEKFVFASEYGTLRLVLRAVGDESKSEVKGTVRSDITGRIGVYTETTD